VRKDVALDELLSPPRGFLESRGGQAVDVAVRAGRSLVQHGHRVCTEELALAASALQPHAQVLGRVLGCERLDAQPRMQPRVQAAVVPPAEPVLELGQPDEDEREQRA